MFNIKKGSPSYVTLFKRITGLALVETLYCNQRTLFTCLTTSNINVIHVNRHHISANWYPDAFMTRGQLSTLLESTVALFSLL